MKIVATTSNKPHSPEYGNYLIEATGKEIEKLFGGTCHSSEAAARYAIGTVIKVDAAFRYVDLIYRHRQRFEHIAEQLRDAAADIDKFPALLEELSIPEMKP